MLRHVALRSYTKNSRTLGELITVMPVTGERRWRRGRARRRLRTAIAASCLVVCGAPQVLAQDTTRSSRAAPRVGDFEIHLRNRGFRIPEQVVSGLTIQPTLRLQYQLTGALRLAVDAQTVDNSGPGRQGTFYASRTVPGAGSGNFMQEVALEAMWRVWHNSARTRRLSVTGTGSLATRSYWAVDPANGAAFGGNRRTLVPTLGLEGGERFGLAEARVGVVAVMLPADDALYLRRLPGEQASFGTVVGTEMLGEWRVAGGLVAWGRGFLPLTGHNTIRRATGAPSRIPAYDAGIRLELSPALDAEAFASNALGNTGALAYIADREYGAWGVGLRVRPGPRYNTPSSSSADRSSPVTGANRTALALASVAPALLNRGALAASVRWGQQGLLASVEGAPVRQLQIGLFTDLLRGTRDEGEVGAVARLTLLDRAPEMTAGVILAASRTNNPLVNLLAARWDELQRRGLRKGGFRLGDENLDEGRLYVVTGAIPIRWRAGDATTLHAAPIVGYVQRRGVQIGGLALGAEQVVHPSLRLAVESGVAVGRGNRLNEVDRSHAIPWQLGLAWALHSGESDEHAQPLSLELFLTNRAGDSPFHVLRVRSGGAISAGIGMRAHWK